VTASSRGRVPPPTRCRVPVLAGFDRLRSPHGARGAARPRGGPETWVVIFVLPPPFGKPQPEARCYDRQTADNANDNADDGAGLEAAP
jgi:hypothetical protein